METIASVGILILKILGTALCLGLFIGGVSRASPAHRNPKIRIWVEWTVGAIGFITSIFIFYAIWF